MVHKATPRPNMRKTLLHSTCPFFLIAFFRQVQPSKKSSTIPLCNKLSNVVELKHASALADVSLLEL